MSWRSEQALMRDLSHAQGHVPVEINACLPGERPPDLKIKEETEEEFFQNFIGAGDNSAPDLVLIKEMLNMVRDENSFESEEPHIDSNVLEITKLNPLTPEFIPTLSTTKEMPKKPKRIRNVVLESFLNGNTSEIPQINEGETAIKLLKPADFNTFVAKADDNVENSISEQKKVNIKKATKPLVVLKKPSLMFKKKSVTTESNREENLYPKTESPVRTCKPYQPSKLADDYYKSYEDRKKIKDTNINSIWDIVEKKMQEFEAQKSQANLTTVNGDGEVKCIAAIALPQQRHLLKKTCLVCNVLFKAFPHIDPDRLKYDNIKDPNCSIHRDKS